MELMMTKVDMEMNEIGEESLISDNLALNQRDFKKKN